MNEQARRARDILTSYKGRPLRLMEVCGTHTHEIFRLGIRALLPKNIDIISGPGCPVCVTPSSFIDEAAFLALEKGCEVCTFGDLIRVPGSNGSLANARANGGSVRAVYSSLDAVDIAKENPDKQVVFLSVGFETTTPSSCVAIKRAKELGIDNFSILTANKTMPNAYKALIGSADAFIYPGHVNAITGNAVCRKLCEEEGVSGVVAGFTATELLTALAVTVVKADKGEPFFENCYPSVVKEEGNKVAIALMEEVMQPCDSVWRGLGKIPMSGMELREEYACFDARKKHSLPDFPDKPNPVCRCGDVLQGKCKPNDCKAFGTGCTPVHPIGACMVSGEGACSAFYQYGNHR